MSFPRPLADQERCLIRWMIEHSDADVQKYLGQLENAVVVSECPCGCASIDFQIGSTPPNVKAGMQPIANFLYGPEDLSFGAFLFTCDGMLAGLEVYSLTDTPAPLPNPEDLRAFDKHKVEH